MTSPARMLPLDGPVRHTLTLTGRSLLRFRHNPHSLIDISAQPIMLLLLVTYVFGGQLGQSTHAYLQFVVPGLIAQNAVFAAMRTAVGLNADITKGIFDRFRSLPIPRLAPLAGRVLADVITQLWAIALLLGLGYALGFRIAASPLAIPAACLIVLALSLAVSWAAVLPGLSGRSPEGVLTITLVTAMPLTFASGAFVRVSTLPGWLQAFVKVNPVTTLASSLRGLLTGGPVAGPAVKTVAAAAVVIIVFTPAILGAYRRRA